MMLVIMAGTIHQAEQHRSGIGGLEAFSLASDRCFPRHAHDQFGIGVIHVGAQRSWSGIGQVEAAAGDVITVNPGEMHDGSAIGGKVRAWRMLYLDSNLLSRSLPEDLPGEMEFTRPAFRDPALAGRFAALFAAITAPVQDALATEEALLQTLAHLLIRHGNIRLRTTASTPTIAAALRRLDQAPEQPATLTELAALCGISRFQLLRGFHRSVGATPHAYLLQRRVRLAKRLLAMGRPPADVAAESGFADQSHLTRAFRRQFGTTPARYRAALA